MTEPKEREQAMRYWRHGRWLPSRFMPHWAARDWRGRITKITPMRVQDVTEEIAQTEGIEYVSREPPFKCWRHNGVKYPTALDAWRVAWEEIHPGSREKNEWVWLNEFSSANPRQGANNGNSG